MHLINLISFVVTQFAANNCANNEYWMDRQMRRNSHEREKSEQQMLDFFVEETERERKNNDQTPRIIRK